LTYEFLSSAAQKALVIGKVFLGSAKRATTLVAIAALAAFGAQAQSSVTIYGQVDSGIYNIKKANGTDASNARKPAV